jgi:orotate phosphoribosyltransferase
MQEKIDLRHIDPDKFRDRDLSTQEILSFFRQEDAFWLYPGNPRPEIPHAKLTTGKCSNGFFDCMRVLCYPRLAEILGRQLGRNLKQQGIRDVDYVLGSPYAAITFSHEVAKALGAISSFCTKDPSDPKGKRMLWGRMQIPEGSRILQIEELITTSFTFREMRRAVEADNQYPVEFYDTVGALVHRPEKLPADYDGRNVLALVEVEIQNFDPGKATCPYCATGSEPTRPKENWSKFIGQV